MITVSTLDQSATEKRSLQNGYLYKDIKFDLEFSRFIKDDLYSKSQPKDLAELQDAQAIFTAVKNILTTIPGEKLLNPRFGLDLRAYLFEPINTATAYIIATSIYESLGIQEPRILLYEVTITGDEEQNEYLLDIIFSIPTLDIYNLNLKATLNRDGYVII